MTAASWRDIACASRRCPRRPGSGTRWHFDVLRGLDYFRTTGEPPDDRVEEAIELVQSKQQPDGTWLLENTHKGAIHFEMDAGDGKASRWNTLRALRVLRWSD